MAHKWTYSSHLSSFVWSCFPRFPFCGCITLPHFPFYGCITLPGTGPLHLLFLWPTVLSLLSALLGCSLRPLNFLLPSDSAPDSSSVVSFVSTLIDLCLFLIEYSRTFIPMIILFHICALYLENSVETGTLSDFLPHLCPSWLTQCLGHSQNSVHFCQKNKWMVRVTA